jgi:hypothetical protein
MYIITLAEIAGRLNVGLPNGTHTEYLISPKPDFDYDNNALDTITTFMCADERTKDRVVEGVTAMHPGKNVSVYKMESVSIRPAGELQHKKLTKDGALPF